jgi:hypothetical protein
LVCQIEEHRQRVYENRVLRRIFGPNRDWRRLHNAEIHDLNILPNDNRLMKSRRMRLTGHVASMGEKRGAYKILVGKSQGRRPFGRPKYRLENNIKMDLQEIKWGWSGLFWLKIGTSGGLLCTP